MTAYKQPIFHKRFLIAIRMNLQVIDLQNTLWLETLQKLRHDIYHTPEYVYIESRRTQTTPKACLIVDHEKIFFVPYLVRKCDDILAEESLITDIYDVISPYGYGGILLSEAGSSTPGFADFAMNELKRVLRTQNICSAFLRLHPILNHHFKEIFHPGTFTDNGKTISVDLTLSESQIWAHTRKGHQSTINKCKRLGFTAKIVAFEDYLDDLLAIYEETMNRVSANKSYYFDYDYYTLLSKLGHNINLGIVELEGEIACASLFFECGGIVQAHLGGTKNKFLHQSPFNLLLHYVRLWAKERGNEFLHLGGGVGGSKEDSLYTFKSGFSRQKHNFMTLRLITDEEKYQYLVDLRAKALKIQAEELLNSYFFPAYRSIK
ncbi:MAG: GNAT family N-acetyltransferase [Aulosira sp. DedQUE10]|nr:GNAT family N-acetyltransferase [Aulosira sp. DedQUE10]